MLCLSTFLCKQYVTFTVMFYINNHSYNVISRIVKWHKVLAFFFVKMLMPCTGQYTVLIVKCIKSLLSVLLPYAYFLGLTIAIHNSLWYGGWKFHLKLLPSVAGLQRKYRI